MSKTLRERSSEHTKRTESPIDAFERCASRNPLPAARRMTVAQTLARGSRSLEEANRAISARCARGDLVQVRPDVGLYLVDPDVSSETLLDLLTEHTANADCVDSNLVAAINARRQQLRTEADRDE